ncbi:MAG TPA: sulfite exporter TauE/SafE family protein [Candidatus Saccharimonadales bacterium]|nr:sulfite exporter TauE/SafE family protein [Candidatus Saccharimonadales bacterium]
MEFIYLATFFVAFASSILSGMAGSGGGYIMAPYWLLTGMTPAQAATSGAFVAGGMAGSSLAAFRGSDHMPKNRKLVVSLVAVTLVSSAVGPFFLQHTSADTFKPLVAIITIVALPLLFIRRPNIELSRKHKTVGMGVLIMILLASSYITSSAFSLMIAIVLSQMFSLTVLQSTALRRLIGIVQSAVMFSVLFALGNFVWAHAIAGVIGGILGSYIGTKFAIKRGERFAKYALATGAVVGAIALLA